MTIPVELAAAVIVPLVTVIGVLWRKSNEWEERWQREVKRGVKLALSMPRDSIPDPDWEEDTKIKRSRSMLETSARSEIDRMLSDYLESTPPDRKRT